MIFSYLKVIIKKMTQIGIYGIDDRLQAIIKLHIKIKITVIIKTHFV